MYGRKHTYIYWSRPTPPFEKIFDILNMTENHQKKRELHIEDTKKSPVQNRAFTTTIIDRYVLQIILMQPFLLYDLFPV